MRETNERNLRRTRTSIIHALDAIAAVREPSMDLADDVARGFKHDKYSHNIAYLK